MPGPDTLTVMATAWREKKDEERKSTSSKKATSINKETVSISVPTNSHGRSNSNQCPHSPSFLVSHYYFVELVHFDFFFGISIARRRDDADRPTDDDGDLLYSRFYSVSVSIQNKFIIIMVRMIDKTICIVLFCLVNCERYTFVGYNRTTHTHAHTNTNTTRWGGTERWRGRNQSGSGNRENNNRQHQPKQ